LKIKNKKFFLSLVIFFFIISVFKIISIFFSSQNSSESSKFFRVVSISVPKSINFANENVPIHNPKVLDLLKKEFSYNSFWDSQLKLFYQRSYYWFPMIEKILKNENIPDDFKYLAVVESGLVNNKMQRTGAAGFWQFIPTTAQNYGLIVNENLDERYDLEKSTYAACRYFKDAYKLLGSYTLVAASYNMGINGIHRKIKQQENQNYYDLILSKETSKYLFRALAAKTLLSNPRKYGVIIKKNQLLKQIEIKKLFVDSTVNNIEKFAQFYNMNINDFLLFNPWYVGNAIVSNKNKKSKILIPVNPNYKKILVNFGFIFQNPISLNTKQIKDSIKEFQQIKDTTQIKNEQKES
jgi:hypothetical protein